jgi:hypothetical protein
MRRVGAMTTLNRIFITAALAALSICPPAMLPAAAEHTLNRAVRTDVLVIAQINSSPDTGSTLEANQLRSVLGMEVRTDVERNIGRIVDLLAQPGGAVEAALIELDGFLGIGARKVAVEWSALGLDTSGKQPVAVLYMTRDQLRAAPEYKADQPFVVRRIVPPAPQIKPVPPEVPAVQGSTKSQLPLSR